MQVISICPNVALQIRCIGCNSFQCLKTSFRLIIKKVPKRIRFISLFYYIRWQSIRIWLATNAASQYKICRAVISILIRIRSFGWGMVKLWYKQNNPPSVDFEEFGDTTGKFLHDKTIDVVSGIGTVSLFNMITIRVWSGEHLFWSFLCYFYAH